MIDTFTLLDVWANALWRASWQGGLAALAVWFVGWLVPSLPARFQAWLWRLVMVKFLVVLLWSAPLQLPLLPAAPLAGVATWEVSDVVASVENLERGTAIAVASPEPVRYISPLLMLFIAWTVVVGVQVIRIGIDYRAANCLRTGCRPSEDKTLRAELATACKSVGLRRSPQLLEAAGQGSPLLIGIFRPAIILPETTLSRLSDAERSLVIGHELAHARRGDLFWSLFATIVRALFCFHPLAWLSERQLRLSQEIAADELSITFQKQDPVSYATLLVSVISKLGPRQLIPALSVGVEGSHRSLRQRFSAMRFMKPVSRPGLLAYGSALCLLAVVGVVPWTVVAAQAPAPDKVEPKPITCADSKPAAATELPPAKQVEVKAEKVQSGGGRGKFVSYQDDTLTIRANDRTLIKNKLPESSKTFVWHDDGGFKPAETAATLKQVEVGMWIHILVEKGTATIRIGARKAQTVGSFVSFKDNRLLLISKSLGESYVKKYGNQIHFNKFRDDVQAFESIDGGDYQLLGLANKVLGNVKEGTIITIHGAGDDNITLVQIGVPTKK